MNAPLAVSPNSAVPGVHLVVNLLRGAQGPRIPGLRALILSTPETGAGDLSAGTLREDVASPEEFETAIGRGLGYFGYKALFANYKVAVDLICVAESAGAAASATGTYSGTPTSNTVHEWDIMGVIIQTTWLVGDTDDDAAADAVATINSHGEELFVVASAVENVVTLTARSKGPCGNDAKVSVRKLSGTGTGAVALSGAALAGGTTEVDITTALATAQIKEYDFIVPCLSQADSASASGASNPARLATHIDSLLTGSQAKLQQGVIATTGSRAAGITNTEAVNHTNLEHVNFQNSRDLPCEVACAEVGDRMRRRQRESNANRIKQPIRGLRGAADKVSNIPTDPQFDVAASAGLSIYSYDANGDPVCVRPITTYHEDTNGNPDGRCFDVNEVDALYDYVKDLRTGLPLEFMAPDGQVKVQRNRVSTDDELPEGTVEVGEIKSWIVSRTLSFWVPKGVIQGPAFEAAVADGSLIVEVNDEDETQVDIFIPAKAVKILAKMSLYVAKEG